MVTWRGLADNCGKYLSKGSKVGVIGTINTRNYEDSNGVRRYVTEVVADEVEFIVNRLEGMEKELFSLSDCDMTTAREFITYLIEFIVLHEIPTKKPLAEQCEDIQRFVYFCLMNKRCCITHRRAGLELHHVDAVGIGRNRKEITHIGMRALPLGAQLHGEAHKIGNTEFMDKYHLEPVAITEEIAKVYKLGKKEKSA